MPRILIGGLRYEANTFAPGVTTREAFERGHVLEGDAVLAADYPDEITGARRVAQELGVELVGLFDADGGSGPVVEDATFIELRDLLIERVVHAAPEADGIFLALHGAMVAESFADPEGDLLERVRRAAGDVPIAVSLDLHCHMTATMAQHADVLVAFRTCPHVDFVETGARAMRLLIAAIEGDVTPRTVMRSIPLISPAERHDTNHGPIVEVMALARELERRDGVLAVSVLMTQPWLDIPDHGWSVIAVIDTQSAGAESAGHQALDELAHAIWSRRMELLIEKPTVESVLQSIADGGQPDGTLVLSDGADSPSAGSTGDGVTLLRALLSAAFADPACVIVTDGRAARTCAQAGIGETISLTLGGQLTPRFFEPVDVTGEVVTLCDGRYMSDYPPGPVEWGLVAVLRSGAIDIVISEFPATQLDYGLYARVGLDLTAMRIVGVKSAGGYRAHYGPIAAAMIDIAGPGPSSSELTSLPFRNITRPLFPFDELT